MYNDCLVTKIVLYQCAIPLGPFESIVDLSKTFQSPSSLIPIITAADAAIAAHRMNIAGDDLAYDTVRADFQDQFIK